MIFKDIQVVPGFWLLQQKLLDLEIHSTHSIHQNLGLLLVRELWTKNRKNIVMYSEKIKTGDHIYTISLLLQNTGGCIGRDHMVVGSTTIHAISAYQHWCEFESRPRRGVIKFVSDMIQVGGFLWVPRFPPPIQLTATI